MWRRAQGLAAARDVIALVGMQLGGPLAPLSIRLSDRRDGIEQRPRRRRSRGGWRRSGARRAGCRSRSTTTWRFVPGLPRSVGFGPTAFAPLLAGMLAESSEARLQSMLVGLAEAIEQRVVQRVPDPRLLPVAQASPAGHAGAAAQLRWQHLPGDAALEHEDDAGQARRGPETRGRPPLGLGGSGGSSGATRAHNSSLTSGLLMPKSTMPPPGFERRS